MTTEANRPYDVLWLNSVLRRDARQPGEDSTRVQAHLLLLLLLLLMGSPSARQARHPARPPDQALGAAACWWEGQEGHDIRVGLMGAGEGWHEEGGFREEEAGSGGRRRGVNLKAVWQGSEGAGISCTGVLWDSSQG
ncbi:hypothetical protein E2C01_074530 [Portunus trituberculatus]|uniref:Uncharacterized protein n=1 Tax=Portunus trituberculatus TaxID=210409 RepID=A0A5B7IDR1_PORTR|nr:hypothetical protein [Portunus trituberculatus]